MLKIHFDRYLKKSQDDTGAVSAAGIVIDKDDYLLTADVFDDVLWVYQAYGNGQFLDFLVTKIAKENKCTSIKFMTKRSPRAWNKLLGYEFGGYIMSKEI